MVNIYIPSAQAEAASPYAQPITPNGTAAQAAAVAGAQSGFRGSYGGTQGAAYNDYVAMYNQQQAEQVAQDASRKYRAGQQLSYQEKQAWYQEQLAERELQAKRNTLENANRPQPGSIAASSDNAYAYATEARRKGETIDPYIMQKAISEGFNYDPLKDKPGSMAASRSTVPIRSTESMPLSIPSKDAANMPTTTLFTKYNGQTAVENVKIGYVDSGMFGAYQQNAQGRWLLVSSGSRAALQGGGMTFGKPEDPRVWTQESGGTKLSEKYADVPRAMQVLANPDAYSRPGAERYGGYGGVPLIPGEAGKLRATDQMGVYANPYNLANLVSPQAVNLPKSQQIAMGEIPWGNRVNAGTPTIFRMDGDVMGEARMPAKMAAVLPGVSNPVNNPAINSFMPVYKGMDTFPSAEQPTVRQSKLPVQGTFAGLSIMGISTSIPTDAPAGQNRPFPFVKETFAPDWQRDTMRMGAVPAILNDMYGKPTVVESEITYSNKIPWGGIYDRDSETGAYGAVQNRAFIENGRASPTFTKMSGGTPEMFALQASLPAEANTLQQKQAALKTFGAYNISVGGEWVGSEAGLATYNKQASELNLASEAYNTKAKRYEEIAATNPVTMQTYDLSKGYVKTPTAIYQGESKNEAFNRALSDVAIKPFTPTQAEFTAANLESNRGLSPVLVGEVGDAYGWARGHPSDIGMLAATSYIGGAVFESILGVGAAGISIAAASNIPKVATAGRVLSSAESTLVFKGIGAGVGAYIMYDAAKTVMEQPVGSRGSKALETTIAFGAFGLGMKAGWNPRVTEATSRFYNPNTPTEGFKYKSMSTMQGDSWSKTFSYGGERGINVQFGKFGQKVPELARLGGFETGDIYAAYRGTSGRVHAVGYRPPVKQSPGLTGFEVVPTGGRPTGGSNGGFGGFGGSGGSSTPPPRPTPSPVIYGEVIPMERGMGGVDIGKYPSVPQIGRGTTYAPTNILADAPQIRSVGKTPLLGGSVSSTPTFALLGAMAPAGLLPASTWSIEGSKTVQTLAASKNPFNAGYVGDYEIDTGFIGMAKELGNQGRPREVKNLQEFDAIQSDYPVLFHGTEGENRVQDFFKNPIIHAMKGSSSSGFYTAYDHEAPEMFRKYTKNPNLPIFGGHAIAKDYGKNVIVMKIMRGAKVTTINALEEQRNEFFMKHPENIGDVVAQNAGRFALLHGYDVLLDDNLGYGLILNKSKIAAMREPLFAKPVKFNDKSYGYNRRVTRIIPMGSGEAPLQLAGVTKMYLLKAPAAKWGYEPWAGHWNNPAVIRLGEGTSYTGVGWLQEGEKVKGIGTYDRGAIYTEGHGKYMEALDKVPQADLQNYVDRYYPGMDAKDFRKQEYYAGKAWQTDEWGVVFDEFGKTIAERKGNPKEVAGYTKYLVPDAAKRVATLYPYASRVLVDTGHTHPNYGRMITSPSLHGQKTKRSAGADIEFDEVHDSYKRAYSVDRDDLTLHPPKAGSNKLIIGNEITVGAHGGFISYRSPYIAGEGRTVEMDVNKGFTWIAGKKTKNSPVFMTVKNEHLWGEFNTDYAELEKLRMKVGWTGIRDSFDTNIVHRPPVRFANSNPLIDYNAPDAVGTPIARSASVWDRIGAESFMEVANHPKYNMNARFHKFQPPTPRGFQGGKQLDLKLEDFQRERALKRYRDSKQVQTAGVVQEKRTLPDRTGLDQLFGKGGKSVAMVPNPDPTVLTHEGITWNTGKSDFNEATYWYESKEPVSQKEYIPVLRWMAPEEFRAKTYEIFGRRNLERDPTLSSEAALAKGKEAYNNFLRPENVHDLKQKMTSGNAFNALTIFYDRFGKPMEPQEARHRAEGTIQLGVSKIPVWEVFQQDINPRAGKNQDYYFMRPEAKQVMNRMPAYKPGELPQQNRGQTQMIRTAPIVQAKGIVDILPGHAKWDTTRTDIPMFDSIITADGTKSWVKTSPKATLKMMAPKEFMDIQMQIMDTHWRRDREVGELTKEQLFYGGIERSKLGDATGNLKNKAEVMDSLAVERYHTGEVKDYQEGRHRAYAAYLHGYKKIPVWDIRDKTAAEVKLASVPSWSDFVADKRLPQPGGKRYTGEIQSPAVQKPYPANFKELPFEEKQALIKERYAWQNEGEQKGFTDVYGGQSQLIFKGRDEGISLEADAKQRAILHQIGTNLQPGQAEPFYFIQRNTGEVIKSGLGRDSQTLNFRTVQDAFNEIPLERLQSAGKQGIAFYHGHPLVSSYRTLDVASLNPEARQYFRKTTTALTYPSPADIELIGSFPRVTEEGIISPSGFTAYRGMKIPGENSARYEPIGIYDALEINRYTGDFKKFSGAMAKKGLDTQTGFFDSSGGIEDGQVRLAALAKFGSDRYFTRTTENRGKMIQYQSNDKIGITTLWTEGKPNVYKPADYLPVDDIYEMKSGNLIESIGGDKPRELKRLVSNTLQHEIKISDWSGGAKQSDRSMSSRNMARNAVQSWEGTTYNRLLVDRTPWGELVSAGAIFPNSIDFNTGKRTTFIQFVGSRKPGGGKEFATVAEHIAVESGNHIMELTPLDYPETIGFWQGRGFEFRDTEKTSMLKFIEQDRWTSKPDTDVIELEITHAKVPVKKMGKFEGYKPTKEEAKAFMQKRYPESYKREGWETKQHMLELVQKEEIKEIDLRPTFQFKRSITAAGNKGRAITVSQFAKGKKNPLAIYRGGVAGKVRAAPAKSAGNWLNTQQLHPGMYLYNQRHDEVSTAAPWVVYAPNRETLDKQRRASAVMVWAGAGQQQMIGNNLVGGLIRKQHTEVLPDVQQAKKQIREYDLRRLTRPVVDTRSRNRLAARQAQNQVSDLDRRSRQMVAPAYARDTMAISVPKMGQKIAPISEQRTGITPYRYEQTAGFGEMRLPQRQPFIEPTPYRQPTFTIPAVPIIPPFGFPFDMPGGSASSAPAGRHGKYPFREIIPLNWQLW